MELSKTDSKILINLLNASEKALMELSIKPKHRDLARRLKKIRGKLQKNI